MGGPVGAARIMRLSIRAVPGHPGVAAVECRPITTTYLPRLSPIIIIIITIDPRTMRRHRVEEEDGHREAAAVVAVDEEVCIEEEEWVGAVEVVELVAVVPYNAIVHSVVPKYHLQQQQHHRRHHHF